ncbi:MAG TPA: SAM-dependent methyltransferase [Myxococcales bacterium]|nr:SAM-dependent methyltransferase [Myxococcales bacterium]
MDPRLADNLRHWDETVSHHASSRFYDVEGFLAGGCSLLPIEREALGDVAGKSLLHLQCHFGLDTLSWARRGARVTGLDFSPNAIAEARSLARRAGLDARFVESEVTRAPDALDGERFDVVFTSWGVLGWLPDVGAWARAVAACLKPGGLFYLAELHPTILLFDDPEAEGGPLTRRFGYFHELEPIVEETEGTYAEPEARLENERRVSWIYEVGQVVNALIDAGLQLERLEEHDATCCAIVPGLVQGDDRMWRLPEGELSLPLSFSIRARLPDR